ncbi:MAG: hypothetical protein ABI651_06535 [Verrucomicrobiota bacterium]
MNLNDAQKKSVVEWIAQGMKLSEIQRRINSEFGIVMTYIEVRFLVDDLKLTPKDPEPPKPVAVAGGQSPGDSTIGGPANMKGEPEKGMSEANQGVPPGGGVSVKVATVARPGALVSGSVTFSDGNSAEWHLDQTGRLGLSPKLPGYKPSPADLEAFQIELQEELQKLGF